MKNLITRILLLASILIATNASAGPLVVYNFTGIVTKVGGLGTSKLNHRISTKGVLIYDVESGRAFQVTGYNYGSSANSPWTGVRRRPFVVKSMSDTGLFQTMAGSTDAFPQGTKSYTGVARLYSSEAVLYVSPNRYEASFLFGVNANLDIYPYGLVLLPRTAKLTGFELAVEYDGATIMGPVVATYSFSYSQSKAFNLVGTSLADAVQIYRARFSELGYVEQGLQW